MRQQTSWRVVLGALMLAGLPLSTVQAAKITVDGSTCTLAAAITAANNDTDEGGCTGSGTYGDDTIILATDVTLSEPLPWIESTVIIEGNDHFISGNNNTNIGTVLEIYFSGNLTLNEATVTGANSDDEWFSGGIYNHSEAVVTLTNSTVSGNTGAGIFNDGGAVATLTNSTVSNNTASGIVNSHTGGSVTLRNSTVSNNAGAGIENDLGIVTLTNSTVSGNTRGGISNYEATVTLTDSRVSNNTGGGIWNASCGIDATVTLTNSTVSNNTGSGIENYGWPWSYGDDRYVGTYGIVTLTNSTVSNNTAAGNSYYNEGGGIYNGPGGIVTLTNSTVSNNTAAGNGGGIYNYSNPEGDTTITLTNSTVSGNTAASGGGIYNYHNEDEYYDYYYESTVTLTSSLISGNKAVNEGNELYNNGTINADSYNVFGDDDETDGDAFVGFTPGSNDIDATGSNGTALADILGPLADNGGPTLTHALVAGSPAVDLDATCNTGLDTDQRGEPRPETEGTECDAGAFELTQNYHNVAVQVLEEALAAPQACGKYRKVRKTIRRALQLMRTAQKNIAAGREEKGRKKYDRARKKLLKKLIPRIDGCAVSGTPDKHDWICNCEGQNVVYSPVMKAINYLEKLR